MTLPLDGIKVVDLTHTAPGPHCTMILGDFGADVIRVQEPLVKSGRRRSLHKQPTLREQERQAAFDALGRNKRSVVLDLKNDAAREAFHRLAEDADVVVESFRPGVVKRLGVDYATLSQLNPALVYCSITGYGQDGPYAALPGHDINYVAIGGALSISGVPGLPPSPPGNLLADFAAGGMQAALAVVTALYQRSQTGLGQYLDISMTDGVFALMTSYGSQYFGSGTIPEPGLHRHLGLFPWFRAYETSDGSHFSLGCSEPWFYANLVRAIGREDFLPYQMDTGAIRDELQTVLTELFKTKTRAEWFAFCQEYEICGAPVLTLAEAAADTHIRARGLVATAEVPGVGLVRQIDSPIKFHGMRSALRSTAPLRGQHTTAILSGLGYSEAEQAAMVRRPDEP
ncbi:MAG: CaiB/BaiF CoA transferase family protein [Dehalococcoidia bacterium]